jgi:hypothetical protein
VRHRHFPFEKVKEWIQGRKEIKQGIKLKKARIEGGTGLKEGRGTKKEGVQGRKELKEGKDSRTEGVQERRKAGIQEREGFKKEGRKEFKEGFKCGNKEEEIKRRNTRVHVYMCVCTCV